MSVGKYEEYQTAKAQDWAGAAFFYAVCVVSVVGGFAVSAFLVHWALATWHLV